MLTGLGMLILGAGVGFGDGLNLHPWSTTDEIGTRTEINTSPAISWLFVPPSPKLLAPVSALTAEVLPLSISIKVSFQVIPISSSIRIST